MTTAVGSGPGATGPGPGDQGPDGGAPAVVAEIDAPRTPRLQWWREVIYIVLVYVAYSAVRNQFGSGAGGAVDAGPAFGHAETVIDIERAMGLYFEARLQQWYLDLPGNGLIRVWNVYYGIMHFVVPATALVLLYRRRPSRYRLWRNTLAFTTLLAVVGFATFSLMPPRLMDDPGVYGGCAVRTGTPYRDLEAGGAEAGEAPCDEFGYVDTIAEYGGWASFGSDEMAAVSNQYAAMPSMHIGWSTWCAIVLVPLLRRRWLRALAIAYPLLTLFDIIVTGNHYWIDGLGGLLCLAVGYLVARAATQWWEARRGSIPDPEPEPERVQRPSGEGVRHGPTVRDLVVEGQPTSEADGQHRQR
jgi:hypothetical protein